MYNTDITVRQVYFFAVRQLNNVCPDLFAFLFGFCAPAMVGSLWEGTLGGFIWGGLVARVFGMFKERVASSPKCEIFFFSLALHFPREFVWTLSP